MSECMGETKKALHRLLRRVGREAATLEKWAAEAYERKSFQYSEQYAKQANSLRLVQGFIHEELRQVKP